ncbi:MAG: hypothetical protein AAGA34_00770 [Pseudomonadota bacterium]
MRDQPAITVLIESLRVAGLTPSEAARLEMALTHDLQQRLAGIGIEDFRGPVNLDDLRIELPRRGEPETMGTQIGAQIATALSIPPVGARRPTSHSSGGQNQ